MRTITTSKGVTIELDGDVLAVLEALFKTVWRDDSDFSYEHTVQEIQHLLGQLTEEECRTYLGEALFMSYNRFENDQLDRVMKKLDSPEP